MSNNYAVKGYTEKENGALNGTPICRLEYVTFHSGLSFADAKRIASKRNSTHSPFMPFSERRLRWQVVRQKEQSK